MIADTLRQQVMQRAAYRCEYCLVRQDDVLIPYEVDHIIAKQHRGTDTLDNLALACFHCNRLKGPNIASIDPLTAQLTPLFNPRTQSWHEHFTFHQAQIYPLTAIGRVTVELLQLNHADRIRVRQTLMSIGTYP